MKFRNFIIVLLAVLMAFAFASCKHEPKEEPKPTPSYGKNLYQIEVTEGVDKDYWNRDKIKLEWEVPVKAGDVLTLKYRSERDVYQWDIRDGSLKWVYESKKGSFTDPVLGEDGWYTLTYTFANDINGTPVASNSRFGVYFRGNFVTTDIFEIKDIFLNDEELEVEASNIKSYAQLNDPAEAFDWTVKNYTVLFATGTPGEVDKTPIAEKVVAGGFVTGAPIAKANYSLTIYTDTAHTSIFDPTTPITEEKIFYYEYVGDPRTVTFVTTPSASVIEPMNVHYNDLLTPPAEEPVLEGKAFKAWYKDAELTTPWDFATEHIEENLTLYAGYGDPATVTFNLNGGTFGEGVANTKIVAIGNAVAMPEAPTYGTYLFAGWYADAEFATAYNFATPVEGDITLYAKWVEAVNVTLNLNYEGAPEATVYKAPYGQAIAEDNENLAVEPRTGVIFEGWFTEPACTTAYNYETVLTADIALYAKWSYGAMYRVTSTKYTAGYDHDKFVIGFQDAAIKANDVVSISYRTTEAFTWFSVRKDDNPTYSKWFHEKSSGTWPLFFSSKTTGEDGWTTVTYKFPEPTDDTQAKQIGYGDEGAGFFIYFGNSKMVPGAIMEIRAVMINGKEYKLTSANIDHVLKQSDPIFEADIEDYEWTAKTVTFNTNGGSEVADASVDFGAKVAKPADPTKADNVFAGWFADAEFETAFDFGAAITKATTIYAKWVAPVTLTFDSQSGSAVDAIAAGAGLPIAKPADPTRDGYLFQGWFEEAECTTPFNFAAGIAADKTVYAKWGTPLNLTYNLNYAEAPEPQVAKVGANDAITAPKSPARVGYFFGGWYTDAECTAEFDFAAGIAADKTIYAKWNAPTKSYSYVATSDGDRWQFRWKSSSVSALSNLQPGDTITFMVKFGTAGGGTAPTSCRIRTANDSSEKSLNLTGIALTPVDGWCYVTATIPAETEILGKGILLTIDGTVKTGDTCEIRAISYNGFEIPMSSSSTSSGLYPGVSASFEQTTL